MAKIDVLINGYRSFYKKYFGSDNSLYKELVEAGQSPKTLVVACSDSRADPSIVTEAKPGDIFVMRNVANLVPKCELDYDSLHGVSATLEFAVKILNVENIIVLGHSGCSGIKALMRPDEIKNTDFIGPWMNQAKEARENTISKYGKSDELEHHCEKESITLSLANLMTFPWIKEKVESNDLKLHGWYFSLEDGCLREYDPVSKEFTDIN